MKVTPTSLPDVLIIEPHAFEDKRGFFMETYHQKRYEQFNIPCIFVQDNLSHSARGILRGLHYQLNYPQAKLIQVINGAIFDVAVDIRQGSPTFGKWTGIHLSDKNRCQMFVPEGFAHGFCVLSETADVLYKCTDFYAPDDEGGILWSDPNIGIEWPIADPILSEKDNNYSRLKDIPEGQLPIYRNSP